MYVLSYWYCFSAQSSIILVLFPSLLRNSGNKHQNNTPMGAETVRPSSTNVILYIFILLSYAPQQYISSSNLLNELNDV